MSGRAWMDLAHGDLAAAVHLAAGGLHDQAAFHAHQAAEKALKAKLLDKGSPLRRIHDLLTLADELGAPEAILDACALLNPAYTGSRYPDAVYKVAADDSAELIGAAQEVVTWCE